jgi:hypothetical protein
VFHFPSGYIAEPSVKPMSLTEVCALALHMCSRVYAYVCGVCETVESWSSCSQGSA